MTSLRIYPNANRRICPQQARSHKGFIRTTCLIWLTTSLSRMRAISSASGRSSPRKPAIMACSIDAGSSRRVDRMPRLGCQQDQESQLGAAIAVAKGVNGIEVGDEVGSFCGKLLVSEATKMTIILQVAKRASKLIIDVFGIEEHTASRPRRACAPGPSIDVLENVPVNGSVMTDAPAPARHRLQNLRPVATASNLARAPCEVSSARDRRCPDNNTDR